MLVLTRKVAQKVIIGDKLIVITILESKDGIVKIGIEAPREMIILREEIY